LGSQFTFEHFFLHALLRVEDLGQDISGAGCCLHSLVECIYDIAGSSNFG